MSDSHNGISVLRNGEVRATVGKIVSGNGASYVVAYVLDDRVFSKGTPITFSLGCWQERKPPLKGQVVVLREIQRFAKGWRAFGVCPVTQHTGVNSR